MTRLSPAALESALHYAERGWSVFPVPVGEKKSHKKAEHSGGKKWGATTDANEIRNDFTRWPEAGVGIPTGEANGFWVVEADTLEGHDVDGLASLRALEAEHGALPATLQARSPSGSIHYYFHWPEGIEIRNSTSQVGPGIDVRGTGGMVLAPPSLVPGKGAYAWINYGHEIVDAPGWLIELATTNNGDEDRHSGDEPEAERELIAAALAVIPCDDPSFDDFNRVGMATGALAAPAALALPLSMHGQRNPRPTTTLPRPRRGGRTTFHHRPRTSASAHSATWPTKHALTGATHTTPA